jgi:hypothetical protein
MNSGSPDGPKGRTRVFLKGQTMIGHYAELKIPGPPVTVDAPALAPRNRGAGQ